jgi:hypothetical protein
MTAAVVAASVQCEFAKTIDQASGAAGNDSVRIGPPRSKFVRATYFFLRGYLVPTLRDRLLTLRDR